MILETWRKFLCLSILLLGLIPSTGSFSQHVVLDLDWTLIYQATDPNVESESVIRYGSQAYRMTDLTPPFIERLHSLGFRVSYFSGGDEARNRVVIDKIYERVNALFGTRHRPFRLGHRQDLVETGADRSAPFAERFKKDLARWLGTNNLDSVILVDDSLGFTPKEQSKNLLWIQETYDDMTTYEKRQSHRYSPPTKEAWALERNKLAWVLGLLIIAKEDSSQTSFVERIHRLQHDRRGRRLARTTMTKTYEEGLKLLGIFGDANRRHITVPYCSMLRVRRGNDL